MNVACHMLTRHSRESSRQINYPSIIYVEQSRNKKDTIYRQLDASCETLREGVQLPVSQH
jgi:hypothetical protein